MPRGKKRQPQRKNGWQEPLWNLVNRKSGTCEFRRSSRMVTCQRGFWDIWNTDNKKNEIRYFGGWRQDCRLRPFRVCTRPAWGQLVWQRVHRRGVHGEFLRAVQGTARGDGEDRHARTLHGGPEKIRWHQGLRSLLLYYRIPTSFDRWGFFFFHGIGCPPYLVFRRRAGFTTPFGKAFFSFHRPFRHDKNWLSMTIHDRVFEDVPLVISFVTWNGRNPLQV